MMRSLISVADIFSEKGPNKRVALEEKIDDILSRGESDVDLASSGGDETNDPDSDHVYHDTTVDDYALEVFAGYVARKLRKNSCARKCHDCFLSLTKSEDEPALETQYLIEKRSQGHLLTSSRPLFKLLEDFGGSYRQRARQQPSREAPSLAWYACYSSCRLYSKGNNTNRIASFAVVDGLDNFYVYPKLGCGEHANTLTKGAITFYVNAIMIFCLQKVSNKTYRGASQNVQGQVPPNAI